ncbi:aminoglycoside phosphotransferase family enzyme/predicted kinase [Natronocella acetinitrilica]|uniref:Aminoglycoside phosphotransferase family enzyme/predicted kinase n=1 Tax=Natronocella acetinitrilica TaxID=414046 RepID=A0AAE3KDZ2_9GAMM|nr:bifunctional aminoglycoside phosphotransferase/ATP-binding protein [Natronocella acetinitrilica]MCP1676863.1 aminoglycoside phosphotransferase family enzyme/predicted kinase [Natronocella acetinitrilica]
MHAESALAEHRQLIAGLQRTLSMDGMAVETIETHGATVLLAGDHAYKLKKPVDLGFLDYSTLALRQHYCREELRLNRRLAPDLYLAVLPVTGTPDEPELGGSGPVLDHAVQMRRFPTEARLDRVLERGELKPPDMEALAQAMVSFHQTCAPLANDHPLHSVSAITAPLLDNLEDCRRLLPGGVQLEQVLDWFPREHDRLQTLVSERLHSGRVRECHGDLHLANMYREGGAIHFFDGIEFSEPLRYIDVMNEVAFVAMDLDARGSPDLGALLTSHYLECGGDYRGLPLLLLFKCYRALVRAKVNAIHARAGGGEQAGQEAVRYLSLAAHYTEPRKPTLWIMGGLSGSGKSTRALALVEQTGAVRIRSDVERKRLFGLAADARTDAPAGGGIYGPEAGEQTYQRLADLARGILACGSSVIVDAANLRRSERARFRALASTGGWSSRLVWCEADENTLRQRLRQRAQLGKDPSEATTAVLERQLQMVEPPTAEETDPA